MRDTKMDFWISLISKLSGEDFQDSVPEILEELCTFFGFGCSFIYKKNHSGSFYLTDYFALYEGNHLLERLDLTELLGEELIGDLSDLKVLSFRRDTLENDLQRKLSQILHAKSMVLVPITDKEGTLSAFVGIADRRGEIRLQKDDADFTYSVLSTIANQIKLELYARQVDSTQNALESIIDNMGVDIYVNDFYTHEVLFANRSMAAPYGGVSEMIGKICWQVLYDDKTGPCEFCPQKKLIDEHGNPTKIYSWDYQRPFDGAWFRVLSAAFRWTDGRLAHIVSSIDITEGKKNEAIIRKMAEYDHLTGLPNRHKLSLDSDRTLTMMEKLGLEGYLIFFDLDGFKVVNDSLGHATGDELLVKIGERLLEHPLIRDYCYRYGGDEFVILCNDGKIESLVEILHFLTDIFSKPWNLSDNEISLSTSIGISHFPTDDNKTSELLRKADQAMYHAKSIKDGMPYFYNRGEFSSAEEYLKKHKK